MKKNLLISLILVLVILYSILFAQDANSVVTANNQFAFKLYAQYRSKDGNIFFSPFSISSAIAMTYEGARGETADEIQVAFGFPKDDSLRRESFLEINNRINKSDKEYQLHVANALWAQEDYKFIPNYFNLIDKYYGGKVTNLDFVNQTEDSRFTINKWVEEQTNDRIKDLVPRGSITPLTRLVLTNAIYFKGFWLKRFDKEDTKEEDFKVKPGSTIKVPMMYLNAEEIDCKYAETDNLQILELPYKGEELSMLILLPKNEDLKTVEESLNYKKLLEWKHLLSNAEVEIYLPKFKFEESYDLSDTLNKMGMPTAFTLGIDFGGKADFSGMTGKKDLNIDKVVHKAFVEVNEEGTEAAAATAVIMKAGCAFSPDKIKIFRADHPFIFIIQENETGNILFIGRLSSPAT